VITKLQIISNEDFHYRSNGRRNIGRPGKKWQVESEIGIFCALK
jgi:hypothetical protein